MLPMPLWSTSMLFLAETLELALVKGMRKCFQKPDAEGRSGLPLFGPTSELLLDRRSDHRRNRSLMSFITSASASTLFSRTASSSPAPFDGRHR